MLKLFGEIKEAVKKAKVQQSFSQLTTISIGNLITVIITFLGYPILSRLYTDSDFGEFALFQSIFIILLPLTNLNYHEAIVLIRSEYRLNHLIKLLILVSIILAILVSLFIHLSGFQFLGIELPGEYLWLLPVALLFGTVIQMGSFLLLRKEAFKLISIIKVVERAGFQTSAILFFFSKTAFNGLITGMLAGQFFAFLITSLKSFSRFDLKLSPKYAKAILVKYKSFPLFSLPGGFLERLSRHMPILLLSTLVNDVATGQYAMAYKILSLPEIVLGASLGQIFYLKVSKKFLAGERIKPLILKTWGLQTLLGFIPLLIIIFFGEDVFMFILGKHWAQAGEIAQIIAIMIFFLFLTAPTSYALNALNKQHVDLMFGLTTLVSRTGTLLIGLNYFDLYGALLLFTVTETAILIFYNFILLQIVSRWETELVKN